MKFSMYSSYSRIDTAEETISQHRFITKETKHKYKTKRTEGY